MNLCQPRGAGYRVVDLGVNVAADEVVARVDRMFAQAAEIASRL